MQDFFLKRRLKRIEREANDDLRLVLELGPEDFPTHELHHLLRRLDQQRRSVGRLRTFMFLTSVSTTLWIATAFLLFFSQRILAGLAVLSMVPIAGLLLFLGAYYRDRKYFTHRYHDQLVRRIQHELERRRKDARIY
jgi:hypothetical protein